MRQVTLNLLSNAVKFTVSGTISVSVRQVADAVQVSVADTGPGIAERDLAGLFEPFHETRRGREAGGTGLGLAISKSFVELHGKLWVETREHHGSTFHFTLPVKAADDGEAR